jgi:hypothetical protein
MSLDIDFVFYLSLPFGIIGHKYYILSIYYPNIVTSFISRTMSS